MWLMTTRGFVSAVRWDHPGDKHHGMVVLRARDKQHLRDTLAVLPTPRPRVTESPGADYRFRAWVDDDQFDAVVVALAREVTYSNFKSAVLRKQGASKYEKALHRVWSELGKLQVGGPYSGIRKVKGRTATCEDCGHKGPSRDFEVFGARVLCRSLRDCTNRMDEAGITPSFA